jgi:hypothetical protein
MTKSGVSRCTPAYSRQPYRLGTEATQISSSVAILGSSPTTFQTRYQAGVYTDSGGSGAVSTTATLNASYSITFAIGSGVGENWRLDVTTSRVGARTSVDESKGRSAFSLGAVTGISLGTGSLTSGSLGLAAIANSEQTSSVDLAFDQSGTASITGSGTASGLLRFSFTATAQTIVLGTGTSAAGDEAAIRMGIPETLSSFTAGG